MVDVVVSLIQWIKVKTIIHAMNLRAFDLNLLTVFDAISAEKNQSRAANRLGMSQPAMSNALARLREVLDDPLFVRTAQGMAPTVCARELAGPVRQALDLIQSGLERARRGERFDCAGSTRTFVIVVEDYGDTVIVPRLMDWLAQTAPEVKVRLRRDISGATLSKKLSDGSIDLAIQYAYPTDSDLKAVRLTDDEFVVVVREDHPLVAESMSLTQYASLQHVAFGRLGPKGIRNSIVDRELRRLGLVRQIALHVPGFQSMPVIVQSTNLVCTMPRRMAQPYAHGFRLKTLKMPLELPPLTLHATWSASMDRDPAHQWFRKSIMEISRRL